MLRRYFPVGNTCLGSVGDLHVIDGFRSAVAECDHDFIPVSRDGGFLISRIFSGSPVGYERFSHECGAGRHQDFTALVSFIGKKAVKIRAVAVTLPVSGRDIRLELTELAFGASQPVIFLCILVDGEKPVGRITVSRFEIAVKRIFPAAGIVPFDSGSRHFYIVGKKTFIVIVYI